MEQTVCSSEAFILLGNAMCPPPLPGNGMGSVQHGQAHAGQGVLLF